MATNIIVAGVGGQGSILASHIIAEAAIRTGVRRQQPVRVRVGETFGAAMRGGAVASHVRIGPDVYGPLVAEDEADLIIAMEPLEGLRLGARYLSPRGIAVLNERPLPPTDVKIGACRYPSTAEIGEALRGLGEAVYFLPGEELALRAGHVRTLSVVMIGAAFGTGRLPISQEDLEDTIRARVPPKTVEVNLRAFRLGMEAMASRLERAW